MTKGQKEMSWQKFCKHMEFSLQRMDGCFLFCTGVSNIVRLQHPLQTQVYFTYLAHLTFTRSHANSRDVDNKTWINLKCSKISSVSLPPVYYPYCDTPTFQKDLRPVMEYLLVQTQELGHPVDTEKTAMQNGKYFLIQCYR